MPSDVKSAAVWLRRLERVARDALGEPPFAKATHWGQGLPRPFDASISPFSNFDVIVYDAVYAMLGRPSIKLVISGTLSTEAP